MCNAQMECSILADIASGGAASIISITPVGGVLYITAVNNTIGTELFYLDARGKVQLMADMNPGRPSGSGTFQDLTFFAGKLYFSADDGTHGREMWSCEQPASSDDQHTCEMVQDLQPGAAHSSPGEFTLYNDKLYFRAINATLGDELWELDPRGTRSTDLRG